MDRPGDRLRVVFTSSAASAAASSGSSTRRLGICVAVVCPVSCTVASTVSAIIAAAAASGRSGSFELLPPHLVQQVLLGVAAKGQALLAGVGLDREGGVALLVIPRLRSDPALPLRGLEHVLELRLRHLVVVGNHAPLRDSRSRQRRDLDCPYHHGVHHDAPHRLACMLDRGQLFARWLIALLSFVHCDRPQVTKVFLCPHLIGAVDEDRRVLGAALLELLVVPRPLAQVLLGLPRLHPIGKLQLLLRRLAQALLQLILRGLPVPLGDDVRARLALPALLPLPLQGRVRLAAAGVRVGLGAPALAPPARIGRHPAVEHWGEGWTTTRRNCGR